VRRSALIASDHYLQSIPRAGIQHPTGGSKR
jgi:hypothetical protein